MTVKRHVRARGRSGGITRAMTPVGTHPQTYVEKPPIEALPPKAMWRHDGDSRVTAYCHGCGCRVVFTDAGACVWCDRKVRAAA